VKEEYVIKKSGEFHGVPYTILEDGKNICTGEPWDYENGEYEILDRASFDKRLEDFCSEVCGKWEEIDEKRYMEMLEILPPVKWTGGGFFISEAYTLDIHPFHQQYYNGRFYQAMFRINTPRDQILKSLADFVKQKENENV
jgi:hypothetical protein